METNYKEVLNEMVNFQRGLGQHDVLVQNLIQHFLQVDQTVNANCATQRAIQNQNTTSISPFFEDPNTANPFFEPGGATLSVDDFMTDVSGGPLNIDVSKDPSSFNLRTMDPPSRPDSVLTRLMTSGMLPAPSVKKLSGIIDLRDVRRSGSSEGRIHTVLVYDSPCPYRRGRPSQPESLHGVSSRLWLFCRLRLGRCFRGQQDERREI
jgi:hypothetical protein